MNLRNKTVSCAVAICDSPNNVIYHHFPKNPSRREKWESACHREGPLGKDPRICENHFEERYYKRDLQSELLGLSLKRKLTEDAIPSRGLIPGEEFKQVPNERGEEKTAKKERIECIDSILMAYEEITPISDRFEETVPPNMIEPQFNEACSNAMRLGSSSPSSVSPIHVKERAALMSNGMNLIDKKVDNDLDREIKSLREEIHALKWLSDRKEREWNKILRLLKMKEEKLIFKTRKRTIVQRESRIAAASLLVTAAAPPPPPQRTSVPSTPQVQQQTTTMHNAASNPLMNNNSNNSTSSLTISPVVKAEKKSKNPDCQGCNAKTSLFVCAGCSNRWYCSRECQAKDWDEHADFCCDETS